MRVICLILAGVWAFNIFLDVSASNGAALPVDFLFFLFFMMEARPKELK